MKKVLFIFALAFALFSLLGGCQRERTPYTGDGWGNTASNIIEGGYIAKGEDGYYFYLNDGGITSSGGLYHIDETGEITLLRRGLAYEINVVGDQIYFVDGAPGHICRISTNGKGFKVINHNRVEWLSVNPTCMVYRDRGALYIADGKGKSPRMLVDYVLDFVPYRDSIVFVQYHTDQDGIYQIGLDGSNLTCLSEVVPISLTSNNQNIYYSLPEGTSSFGETGGKVYQIDENGETTQLPVEDLCWNMNATEDYIFYRNQTEKGDLYRMDLDGNNAICLQNENAGDINVLGDLVLFRVITTTKGVEKSGLYTMKSDGSGLHLWTGELWDQE